MDDTEFERFKCEINLSEYAAGQGYRLDRRESSRNSVVMRHADGDKIVITRGGDGHWLYFSVRDMDDNGTLIDFVQRRQGLSFAQLRQALRPWIGVGAAPSRPAPLAFVAEVAPSAPDRQRVIAAWNRMQPASDHPYLCQRGLGAALTDSRFRERIRRDRYGNAVFPHYNRDGLCGYELKNTRFTGFAAGGVKALWLSTTWRGDRRLVLAESAIDALSYHLLHPLAATRYTSSGGALSAEQQTLLVAALARLGGEAEFVIATDNDAAGETLATTLTERVTAAGFGGRIVRARPPLGKDWNDTLRQTVPPV